MISKITFFTLSILIGSASFFAGYMYCRNNLLNLPTYRTNKTLILSSTNEEIGSLPAGSRIHLFRELPEITTYLVYINLKERDILKPDDESRETIRPISAYVE